MMDEEDNSAFHNILGMFLCLANIVFLGETLFLGEQWWHGLVVFVVSLLAALLYATIIRKVLWLILSYPIWVILETIIGIGLPIYCQFCLFN